MLRSLIKKLRNPFTIAVLLMAITSITFFGFTTPSGKYHSQGGRMFFALGNLTLEEGEFFTGSGNCVNCHNSDPEGVALVDENGVDVSPVKDWAPTMMANAAKDPFWRAKVQHETLVNPNIAADIENLCTDCHAPQGHSEYHMTGQGTHYSMEYLLQDSLGLDGVGCIGCHGIEDIGLRDSNNGNQPYNELSAAYGTFADPWSGPMIQFSGFSPVQSAHMGESEVCAGCHSLFVSTVDYDGEQTGNTFFEQSTYHEWLNSSYDEMEIECQECHMPDVGEVKVSNVPTWLFPREFQAHHLVGGNAFMLRLMKQNADELDLSATDEQFDMVIDRTIDYLQEQSLELDVEHIGNEQDSAVFHVTLTNEVGHKFPSGYASRLLFVEFKVEDENGNVLFHNGLLDENYEIIGRDEGWEPHYDVIRSEEEVQIYEQVVGDFQDQPTTVLEQASYSIKDNRLVPLGYSMSHSTYDTTSIAGGVLADPNFNKLNGVEGSGTDELEYRVELNGYVGPITIETRIWYQSMPPRWMEMMFSWDDPEINAFKEMYDNADQTPILVSESIVESTTSINDLDPLRFVQVGPNPSNSGRIRVFNLPQGTHTFELYSISGQLVDSGMLSTSELLLPETEGVYMLVIDNERSFRIIR